MFFDSSLRSLTVVIGIAVANSGCGTPRLPRADPISGKPLPELTLIRDFAIEMPHVNGPRDDGLALRPPPGRPGSLIIPAGTTVRFIDAAHRQTMTVNYTTLEFGILAGPLENRVAALTHPEMYEGYFRPDLRSFAWSPREE